MRCHKFFCCFQFGGACDFVVVVFFLKCAVRELKGEKNHGGGESGTRRAHPRYKRGNALHKAFSPMCVCDGGKVHSRGSMSLSFFVLCVARATSKKKGTKRAAAPKEVALLGNLAE